jgi:mxaJ protein
MMKMLVSIALTQCLVLSLATPCLAADPGLLRVCADPDNLPFSNRAEEGFENKIARVLADAMGRQLMYFWWPHQRKVIKNTLSANECDVLIGVPQGLDKTLTTAPYYRSAYAIVQPAKGADVKSLADIMKSQLKVGVFVNTPPQWVLDHGTENRANLNYYPLFYDYTEKDAVTPLQRMTTDLEAGRLDVAVVWGPSAGYIRRNVKGMAVAAIPEAQEGLPMAFNIAMAVSAANVALKNELDATVAAKRKEIEAILNSYGVPLLPTVVPAAT